MPIPSKDQKFSLPHYDRPCFLKNIITKQIEQLLELKWWDWEIEKVTANASFSLAQM